jgi:Uroporphyrinogen decarboxylase (URO-D)
MTTEARDRIEQAVKLQKPDRVPVAPSVGIFAGGYSKVSQHNMLFDVEMSGFAVRKVSRELGPLDGFLMPNAGLGELLRTAFVSQPLLPGIDGVDEDAVWQLEVRTVMSPEEYAALAEDPYVFIARKTIENRPDLGGVSDYLKVRAHGYLAWVKAQRAMRSWRKLGLEPLIGSNIVPFPLEQILTSLRRYPDFVTDMYRHPDEIHTACAAMMRNVKRDSMAGPWLSGIRRVFIGLSGMSGPLLGRKQFEELVLPQLEDLVHHLVTRGVTPVLHLQNDWTDLFGYLRALPRASCVLSLDGTSNIFEARDMLGDRMCIHGDVPASMLKLGEPEEVDEYCRRLVVELGSEGGFILGSGGEMPIDTKLENAKVMFNSARLYSNLSPRRARPVFAELCDSGTYETRYGKR